MSEARGAGPFESASIPDAYRRLLQPVMFEPWAVRLIDYIGLSAGQPVLDVASGTGAVARAAATRVGAEGHVIASDISAAMLAQVTTGLDPRGSPVQTLGSPATDLALPDSSVDVVLCQQGFPFIADRLGAAREMRRVLRPGGRLGVAVWLSGRRLEPFETYAEVLAAEGVGEPYPHANDSERFKMSEQDVDRTLADGGFQDVSLSTEDMVLAWPSVDAAALAITGTPFGPVLGCAREGNGTMTLRV
ncbi:MAG: class I SAM-dependent methyltransferase [Nocardioidaceae bacterium]